MNWRIWYINNVIVDGNTSEEWETAPSEGVLGIAAHYGLNSHGIKLSEVWSGSDWYWMLDNKIYQNGESTWDVDYWVSVEFPSGSVSKKGKWTTNEEMESINQQMLNWIS